MVGTVPYMSPEQLEGRVIDHRTDIFSLGVVLYEMATGEQPFRGGSAAATSSAILRDTPPPVTERNRQLPRHLGRIIQHCLQKDPLHRYQTARDVLNELVGLHREIDSGEHAVTATATQTASQARQAVSGTAADRSIAVLPFINMSADPEQEYFCDGMADDLIIALSRIDGLRVAPRSSSFRYKGSPYDVGRIGEELRVSTVLEGSVRRMGNRVRITTELVNVAGGHQLWAERYDRELDDVFAIQDETARAIAAQLDVQLSMPSGESIVHDRTVNREAYDLYLKGKFSLYQRHRDGLFKALECFEKAISIDADYALAHVGLAEAHWAFALHLLRPNDSAMRQARKHAERALQIAPALPEAKFSMGIVQWIDWEFDASEASLRYALANLSHGIPNAYLAAVLAVRGRVDEAREQIEASLLKEPFSAYLHGVGASTLMLASDHSGAADLAARGLEFDADSYACHYLRAMALAELGCAADGISHIERAVEISNRAPIQLAFAAYVLGRAGELGRVQELTRELEGLSKTEYVSSLTNVFAAAGLGDWDRAHQLLERHCRPGRAAFFVCLIIDGRFDDFGERVREAPGTRSGSVNDGAEP